jgi:hypothetical protein
MTPNEQMADALMSIFGYIRVEEDLRKNKDDHKNEQVYNIQKDSPR